MKINMEKTSEIGFCFGVRRAIQMIEQAARKFGSLETLGEVVHNEHVLERLRNLGIGVIDSVDEAGDIVAISSHGVTPEIEAQLKKGCQTVIDTTCPFVRRAQRAAEKLAKAGFFVAIYGDSSHAEVKGILGWARGKGTAALVPIQFCEVKNISPKLGILSQTTQIPEKFIEFIHGMIDLSFKKDSEIRVFDTICPGVRKRQAVSLDLANRSDIMLVVGGRSSANTRRLFDLCSAVTDTRLISDIRDIDFSWFIGKELAGITSGTSTPEETVDEIMLTIDQKLKSS